MIDLRLRVHFLWQHFLSALNDCYSDIQRWQKSCLMIIVFFLLFQISTFAEKHSCSDKNIYCRANMGTKIILT